MGSYPKPTVQPGALMGLALLLLVMELRWVGAFLLSAGVHECCHLLALRMMRVPVSAISVGIGGTKIQTPPLTRTQELLIALAGPVGGLLLCFSAGRFPRLAVCAFFHSVCNLMPLYPLDGGRVLRCLIPEKFAWIVEKGMILIILMGTVKLTGLLGLLALAVIFGKPLLEKYLANRRGNSYNSATI